MWEEQDANAAVALVLRLEDGRPWILFVKRIQNSSDPWSGQIALPGGKRQPEDEDLKETVIRETLEETKINLLDNCRFLGTLSTFQSKPRPEVKVLPFVILFRSAPSIRLNERELEEYFWIPLDELVKNRTMAKSSFGKVAAYTAGNRIIWGLTYRIVENLIHCIQKGRQLGNSNDLEHKT
jgi:8-oxo-dGTP pyrophosphatase MutT (NUDIX family)